MAKTRGPLMSVTAHGSFADVLTYLAQNTRQIVKRKAAPSGTPSASQTARRLVYANGCAAWAGLSPGEKSAWSSLAHARKITPFNAFMSDYLLTHAGTTGTVWDGGSTTWDGGSTTWDT
jgi:hypothetical protein